MSEIDRGIEQPVYRQIAAALRERIAAGTYAPGRAIPSAAALAAEFGVAVMTVRSALRLLAAEGLVRTQPRRGTYVTGEPAQAPPRRAARLVDPGQAVMVVLFVLATAAALACSAATLAAGTPSSSGPAAARVEAAVDHACPAPVHRTDYDLPFRAQQPDLVVQ